MPAVIVLLTREFSQELRAAAFYLSDYYNAWVREGMFALPGRCRLKNIST